ncbi:DUF2284 domain-containing protein [candidate division KSB1 bacterium]
MPIENHRKAIEDSVIKRKAAGYTWIQPADIVVANWVRMKCMYGCPDYDNCLVCPPKTPAISECREFFSEYSEAVLLHYTFQVDDPDERHEFTKKINAQLIKLEREVFLMGFPKAFIFYVDPCNYCDDCSEEMKVCTNRKIARPSLEGFGVDVYSTVRNASMPIHVLTDYKESMNRYGLLLVK